MTPETIKRVDNFTDASFAFAVSLMVVGAGGSAADAATLESAVAAIPSFAIGFAIIAMFWFSHVRWRALRGAGDIRSLLLTLLLVFLVLIYIVPLRSMALSFAAFLVGDRSAYRGSMGQLFTIYGFGFTAMSVLTAALFRDALRNEALDAGKRREAAGQSWIWVILSVTGLASAALAMIPGPHFYAPFLYATLPVSIGLFSWRWRWTN
ncbi:TMEM175 family protein [Sphingomonas sp. AOB5]|uniref:TMEM175 family protein n=1 Tax=Sphingomonas sp. AOB5 TaxID=3034017 RepID=UPI0023F69DE2|nr:TMEM175 family protein [Sphingomonas sp. AOB5]MDF7775008.1 TMEM175 family protein [Sphingomonas sp. AOB5]